MRITGRAVTDKERAMLTEMAKNKGADEVTIGFMDFYDGYNTHWKMVARFIKNGEIIDWCSFGKEVR